MGSAEYGQRRPGGLAGDFGSAPGRHWDKSSESIELRGLISSRQFALPLASASTNIRKILSRESEATCSALVLTWIERGLAPRDSSAATTSSRSSLTAAMSAHLYSPLLNLTLAP